MKRWRNTEHRELIVALAKLFEPHTYVEIGVQRGYVFNAVAPLVERAVAVDTMPISRINRTPNVFYYQMASIDFAAEWNEPIDLLFIDADHRKEAVLKDFDLLAQMVSKDPGLILLHDTFPMAPHLLADGYCSSAWEAAEIIRKDQKYREFEIVTLPGPWAGLSICRRSSLPGWMAERPAL